jgi:hypothetical protein
VTAFGGVGRDGSIVGGLACLGLLVAEPLADWFAGVRGALIRHPTWRSAIGMGLAQRALVLVTGRVAGFRDDKTVAAVIAAAALLLAAITCVVIGQIVRRRPQSLGASVDSAVTR